MGSRRQAVSWLGRLRPLRKNFAIRVGIIGQYKPRVSAMLRKYC